MTCPELITIVNSILLNDITGKNPRLFKPNEQYTYNGIMQMTNDPGCDVGCGFGIVAFAIGTGDFTNEIPENPHLQIDVAIVDLCTGEILSREGTVSINGFGFPLGEEFYVLQQGLSTVEITMTYNGVTLKMRQFYVKDSSNVVTKDLLYLAPTNDVQYQFPVVGSKGIWTWEPTETADILLTVDSVTPNLYILNRQVHQYTENGNYIQRYSFTSSYGDVSIEFFTPVTNCVQHTKKCCADNKYYEVECNGNKYWLPSEDVVETSVVIPMENRDFDKDLSEKILQPPNWEPDSDFRPDPREITRRANTNYM